MEQVVYILQDWMEFLDNKEAIVADVLVKLKHFAKVEAELLFREFYNYPGDLVYFSKMISDTINSATDAVSNELQSMSDDQIQLLTPLIKNHLPKIMAEMGFHRLHENVPKQYILAAIASSLASKIVYTEGINFVRAQPPENLADLALKYIAKEREIALLEKTLEQVKDIDEESKAVIMDLIHRGGVRTSLNIF